MQTTQKYKIIDLFAGIGGIRLGFEQVFGRENIECVFGSEINKFAAETYKINFGDDILNDITQVNEADVPDHDILLAGFPCQNFSISGKQLGFNEARGTLFFDVARIIKEKQPNAFLLENVKNLQTHDKGKTFTVIINTLEQDLNYHIYYKVINALKFVPQNRPRIFIVGFRENLSFSEDFGYTDPKDGDYPVLETILQDPIDIPEDIWISEQYLRGLKKHRARHEAKGNGFGYRILDRQKHAYTLVCGGMGRERNLVPETLHENSWEKEGDSIRLRNHEGLRNLTPRECARLQGFPESYILPKYKTRAYKQISNSVAIPVIKYIAGLMLRAMESGPTDKPYKNKILTLQPKKQRFVSLDSFC